MRVFRLALAEILRWEGGFSDHPGDPGGATNRGVTQAVYDAWRRSRGKPIRSVREITNEEVEAIYYERYWVPIAAYWEAQDRPGVALYFFDTAVQHGVGTARSFESRLSDVLRLHPLDGLAYLHRDRTVYYTRLKHFSTFGRGWMRRAAHIYVRALELEHPGGVIRCHRLILDGHEFPLKAARWVGEKLYVRRA